MLRERAHVHLLQQLIFSAFDINKHKTNNKVQDFGQQSGAKIFLHIRISLLSSTHTAPEADAGLI